MTITKTIQRRLESLEREERFRKEQELQSLSYALIHAWKLVLPHYLGGLVYDDEKDTCSEEEWASGSDGEEYAYAKLAHHQALLIGEGPCNVFSVAVARALKCSSMREYIDLPRKRDGLELCQRFMDAYRRLFAKVGLDFDTAARDVLFDAFEMMVNQLPKHCLDSLRSELRHWCPHIHIPPAGSNLPRVIDADNFLLFA
jgi:hypothetical protein